MARIYVLDTSELINLFKLYPPHVFPSIYDKIDDLIKQNRIMSPYVVFSEIKNGHDDIIAWCKDNIHIFRKHTSDVELLANKIIKRFPKLINANDKSNQADPYIIAFAYSISHNISSSEPIIVTAENKIHENKIPFVAREYSIKSFNLLEMFQDAKFNF